MIDIKNQKIDGIPIERLAKIEQEVLRKQVSDARPISDIGGFLITEEKRSKR